MDLEEEVILPRDLLLVVEAFRPKALLPGEVLVVDGFQLDVEDFHPNDPHKEALVVEAFHIKVSSLLFTGCNQNSHFWQN